jgi:MFS family permease
MRSSHDGQRLGLPIALALAAASTGVIVPALRGLVEQSGHGSTAAGVFIAAHVAGGVVGAALGTRALRRAGSARRLAIAGLGASIVVTLAIAAVDALAVRIGLRFVDGICHLLALTALIAAGTAGEGERRAGRAVWLGVAIVIGVAAGLGIGGVLDEPARALVVAAALSAASLGATVAWLPDEPHAPATVEATRGTGPRPIAPGLLAFGERFIFGMLSVASSFLAPPARVGLVLGVFMTASLVAMPVARRLATAWGPRRLAVRATLTFALGLAAAGFVDVFATIPGALVWAIVCGTSAGALYASALVLAARAAGLADRVRDMATVQAAGSAGHACGALIAGLTVDLLPGTLAIAAPGVGIIAIAAVGVWLTVPDAARDCPVIGPLANLGDEARGKDLA